MKRFHVALLVSVFVSGSGRVVSADEKDAQAILDKAIKALGGEDKLTKIEAAAWTGKGKMIIGDNQEHEFTSQTIAQGFDRFRSEVEVANVFGRQLQMLAVLNRDKVWLSVGGMALRPDHALAGMKRSAYLALIPVKVVPLRGPGFKVQAAGEEQVEGEPALVIKVMCPDGSEMAISFNKSSGRPVKAAGKVFALDDREVMQETIYGVYRDFGGIQVATRLEVKIDGKPYRRQELTEFKILDKVEPSNFSAPADGGGPEREANTVPGPKTVKLIDSKEVPRAPAPARPQADSFAGAFQGWRKLPAVFIRDVDAETEVFLYVGWHPVVSADRQAAAGQQFRGSAWRRVDVATGKSVPATWPGMCGPVALRDPRPPVIVMPADEGHELLPPIPQGVTKPWHWLASRCDCSWPGSLAATDRRSRARSSV